MAVKVCLCVCMSVCVKYEHVLGARGKEMEKGVCEETHAHKHTHTKYHHMYMCSCECVCEGGEKVCI
jgi:hypothetical protein